MVQRYKVVYIAEKNHNHYEDFSNIIAESESEAIRIFEKAHPGENAYHWIYTVRWAVPNYENPLTSDQQKEYYENKRRIEEKKNNDRKEQEKIKQEQKRRNYLNALDALREAQSQINTAQSLTECENLKNKFSSIETKLQCVSDSFSVQTQIEECINFRNQVEEKIKPFKKEEILLWFNTAKGKIPQNGTEYQYKTLRSEFADILVILKELSGSFNLQTEITECDSLRKLCLDKEFAKRNLYEMKRKTKMILLSVLYFAVIAGLLITIYHFRNIIDAEIIRGIITFAFIVFGGITGFMLVKDESGCLAVLLGIPIGAGLGGLIGYFLIGLLFFHLMEVGILWSILDLAILILSIHFYRKYGPL